jgi:hypothetical protein
MDDVMVNLVCGAVIEVDDHSVRAVWEMNSLRLLKH